MAPEIGLNLVVSGETCPGWTRSGPTVEARGDKGSELVLPTPSSRRTPIRAVVGQGFGCRTRGAERVAH